MKYLHITRYGTSGNIEFREKAIPTPKPGEVLVKVKATTVNDYDKSIITGTPGLYRLFLGLFKPKSPTPGMELAGEVEDVGEKATHFKKGDRVFADTSDYFFGTFAEYVCLKEEVLHPMPENASFEEAVTLPHAALLAYQGLLREGGLKEGTKVLINGAGGGVGTIALQIARMYQAEVTGVDHTDKLKAMLELGYDHVIDYTTTDFTKTGKRYDLVLDARSTRKPSDYERSLTENGTFVTVGGTVSCLLKILFANKILGKKNLKILALKPNKGLDQISTWFDEGKLIPQIDGPYPFEQSILAFDRFNKAIHKGKVVVSIQ
jgi:NADPH:quinone reductase-like Zn-dependent oxidoreductase